MLDYIILGFLMSHEMSGYDLKQIMGHSTSNFFDASFGSIYPALKKLADKGDVRVKEVIEGGKLKKLYTITDSGRDLFMSWLAQPIVFSRTKPDHLVPMFFYRFLEEEAARERIHELMGKAQSVIDELTAANPEIKEKVYLFQHATLLFGLDYYKLVIDWCQRLLLEMDKEYGH